MQTEMFSGKTLLIKGSIESFGNAVVTRFMETYIGDYTFLVEKSIYITFEDNSDVPIC